MKVSETEVKRVDEWVSNCYEDAEAYIKASTIALNVQYRKKSVPAMRDFYAGLAAAREAFLLAGANMMCVAILDGLSGDHDGESEVYMARLQDFLTEGIATETDAAKKLIDIARSVPHE